MSATNRKRASLAALVTLFVLFVALRVWGGAKLPFVSAEATESPPPAGAAAPVPANGGFIDHSVLDDPGRLPAEDPSPLAVAAYGV